MPTLKFYLTYTKSDDYGGCITELVETTPKKAKEYYYHKEVFPEHISVLLKYFDLVKFDEESERTDDRRFYGRE